MATKRKLSDLVRQEFESTDMSSPTSEVTDSVIVALDQVSGPLNSEATNSVTSELQTSKLTEFRPSEVSESVADRVPRYLMLDRKEARLRADQIEKLNRLTKLLNRKRRGQGERITDNTLIRIAVDLLIVQIEKIEGTTEIEIQESLSLKSVT